MRKKYYEKHIVEAQPYEKYGIPGFRVYTPDGSYDWMPIDAFEKTYHPLDEEETEGSCE